MSAEKISAVVVSLMPWRETSYIVRLFSKEHGMISAVAKGVRSSKKLLTPIERGQLADALVYIRPSRSLQNTGEIQITEYYQSIRESLEKTALRDIALELLIKTIRDAHSHPELYERIVLFFSELEAAQGRSLFFFALWSFMFDMMELIGFGVTLHSCMRCGNAVDIMSNGGYFVIENGAVICRACGGAAANRDFFVPGDVIGVLSKARDSGDFAGVKMQVAEILRLMRLFVSYCRVHCEIGQEFKSVSFLEEIL